MNRFTGAFLVALLVHGLAIYALSQVRTDSPDVNVKQGRASMRMAFQAVSAAPAPTENENPSQTSENSEEKEEKEKQSTEPEEKREKESSSEGITNEPEPSETDESSETSEQTENKGKPDKSKQKEIEKKQEIKEKERENEKNEEQAPESVNTEGVEWVESVDYRENPAPRYPTKARVLGIEGTVRLLVTIDAQGNPESVEIHEESGSYRLDEAARRAVRDWTFAPAKNDGEPVRSKTIVPVTFSLEGK